MKSALSLTRRNRFLLSLQPVAQSKCSRLHSGYPGSAFGTPALPPLRRQGGVPGLGRWQPRSAPMRAHVSWLALRRFWPAAQSRCSRPHGGTRARPLAPPLCPICARMQAGWPSIVFEFCPVHVTHSAHRTVGSPLYPFLPRAFMTRCAPCHFSYVTHSGHRSVCSPMCPFLPGPS